ncbi:hypothetical protein CEXT_406641 [Caerostris extrusa]|uniref:Uncharacterized protein n=1 Tax=Caerostris extrusa TaxID=172846 RepID=A0AAV4S225_CAEEX|nr:hypothetical protein CEXT_406641 [Caerostris extrusa]
MGSSPNNRSLPLLDPLFRYMTSGHQRLLLALSSLTYPALVDFANRDFFYLELGPSFNTGLIFPGGGRNTLRTSLNRYTESWPGPLVSEWEYCRSIVHWYRKPSNQVGLNPRPSGHQRLV